MVESDGSVTVDLSSYRTVNAEVEVKSGVNEYNWGHNYGWRYYGYAALDDLYKDAVTRNIDAFNHEDNVTENA